MLCLEEELGGIHKDQGRKSHQLYDSTYKTAQSDHHPHSTSCFPLPSYPSGCAFILTMLFLFFNPPLWSMRFIYLPFNPVFGALLAVLGGSIQESRCQSAGKCLKEIRKCKVADWTQICWLYAKLTTLNNFLRPKSVKKNLSVCISAAEIDLIIKPRAYQTVAGRSEKPTLLNGAVKIYWNHSRILSHLILVHSGSSHLFVFLPQLFRCLKGVYPHIR